MVASLLEYETVEAEEVKAILDGRPYDRASAARSSRRSETPSGRPAAEREQARREADAPSTEDLAGTGMTLRALAVAAALARRTVAACCVAGVAAAAAAERGALPRGGSYVSDPDPTIGSAAIGLWFRAPGAGYDNATPGIARSCGDGRRGRAARQREVALRARA